MRNQPTARPSVLTVGQLADALNGVPRDMKVWVGVPKAGGGFDPCLCISGISADPEGDPSIDNCGIIVDPNFPFSNL